MTAAMSVSSQQRTPRAKASGLRSTVSASARDGLPAPLGPPPSPDSQGSAGRCLRTGIRHDPERRATAPGATRRSLLRAGTGEQSKRPPPIFTSRSPAAALAWASATSIPSVTKWKVVPPSITIGARAWWVRTKVGAWYGGLSPHQPFQSGPPQSSPAGPNILRPRMKAPKPSAVARAKRSSVPAVFSDHRSKGPGREEPIHQFLAPFAERMLQALVRAGPEAVDGHSKTRYAHLAHRGLLLIAN